MKVDKKNHLVTRKTFATDGQYKKHLRIKSYFEKLINLKTNGCLFLIDNEIYTTPFIEGVEMGFNGGNFRLIFTGCTHSFNSVTGDYDIPWIDVTMKELRERIVPLRRISV